MDGKSSLTLNNQESYAVEPDCRSRICAFDDWDSAQKIARALWEKAALIGEFSFSNEQRAEIKRVGRELFSRLLTNSNAEFSDLEMQVLSLSAILLTQEFDTNEEESKLWDYVFEQLGYDKEIYGSGMFQKLYLRFRLILKETTIICDRFFAKEGQKYYNTLNVHALTPAWTVEHLFNILYSFYSKNLESQYVENDEAFRILVNNICARWTSQNESDAELELRSDSISFSFRMLFKNRPNYMAAVCDALTHKIDDVLKGDYSVLDDGSRWSDLLRQWFNEKSSHEKKQMRERRDRASISRVATKSDDIKPEYRLDNEDVFIYVPRIRMPEIKQRPTAYLLQDGAIIDQKQLSVFGDDLCLTTREFQFPVSYCEDVDWNAALHFSVRIECADQVIFDSKEFLYRNFIVFLANGQETKVCRRGMGDVYLFTSGSATVSIDDPNDNYYMVGDSGNITRLSLDSIIYVKVDGKDLLDSEGRNLRAYYSLSAAPLNNVHIEKERVYYSVFDKKIDAQIVLGENEKPQNYYLQIDSKQKSLYEFGNGQSITVSLPDSAFDCHNVVLKHFESGDTVFDISYVILPNFTYQFNKDYYSDVSNSGMVEITMDGLSRQVSFELKQDEREIAFALNESARCFIQVPRVVANLSGRNAFSLPPKCWYGDFSMGDYIQIQYPPQISVYLVLGEINIPAQRKKQHYDIGAFLLKNTGWKAISLPLGLIVRGRHGTVEDIFITEVFFQETIEEAPLHIHDRMIEWDIDGLFVGDSDSEFKLTLENDQGDPWEYRETIRGQIVEKNFPCRDGVYNYKVFSIANQTFFEGKVERLLFEGSVTIGNPERSRFLKKELRLRKAIYWDSGTTKKAEAIIKDGDGILSDLEYIGITQPDGADKEYPEYEATLYFIMHDGRWIAFNYNENNPKYEWINPVRVWIVNDNRVIIHTASDDPLLINVDRPADIKTVRIVNARLTEANEQKYEKYKDPDYFEYELLPETRE